MALPASTDSHLLTRTLFAINRVFSRSYHHARVLSPCRLPASGPAILICNHISGLDPFVVQGTSPRVIHWMMAKEYFDLPVARWICERVGFIPVARNGKDSASLKAALRTLAAGHVLGLFPEGRISPTRELLPFQNGVAMLANRAKVPIYPCAVEGITRNLSVPASLMSPQDAVVNHGEPFTVRDSLDESTAVFRNTVQQLRLQALATMPPH